MSDILSLSKGAKDELKGLAMKPNADKEDAFALGFFAGQISALSVIKDLGNGPTQEALNSATKMIAMRVALGAGTLVAHLNEESPKK